MVFTGMLKPLSFEDVYSSRNRIHTLKMLKVYQNYH